MKKGGFLRNVLDTIRSNQTGPSSGSSTGPGGGHADTVEFGGLLKPQHFALNQVARHGFPDGPTALAFDPVQKIAAIGTKTGALRVFGRPGVDVWAQHKPEFAVTHIKFIINQGAIITVTADDSIHLWSLRGPNLKLQLSQAGSTGGASSPGQSSHSPVPTGGGGAAATTAIATHAAHHKILDTGAQPGDPDYLMEGGAHQGSISGSDGHGGGSAAIGGKSRESRQPEILHTLKFQRERITCLHQTLISKWLYIGTERGNVHVANVETFELSGYTIPWNKAIELSRKTHPGSIIHLSECPQDTNKLLIGYESGCIVLWDLKQRIAEGRYYHTENLLWLAWHYEGKQFVAAHGDGSLITWQTRSNARPAQVLHPHAKSGGGGDLGSEQQPYQQQHLQQPSMASTFARAFNNELYRPINKVEWKTSKTSNEQFLLFSGGLPYDGLVAGEASIEPQRRQQQFGSSGPPSRQSMGPSPSGGVGGGPLQVRPSAISAFQGNQQSQQQQQYLKAGSASPSLTDSNAGSSVVASPSLSPCGVSLSSQQAATKQPTMSSNLKERKSLRSTSLTVMYGKSITVLEMDETIIDFITVCDLSPYENDASDPFAVLVLLSNDLILIDLTSSGYPSFESPYPSQALNESPVTCVQYLADCSSDLIPFLYSTSQNVVSRAPKKGFSDKEWPINGGEWGQPMQSYPELVITGHVDGTIKFWDMSGVNFDLISKIKTSKLFDRPNKLPNSQTIPFNQSTTNSRQQLQRCKQQPASHQSATPGEPQGCSSTSDYASCTSASYSATSDSTATLGTGAGGPTSDLGGCPWSLMENCFAIERIEYCPASRHLLVAGALSQVIQFKLNKRDSSPAASEVIIVDPVAIVQSTAAGAGSGASGACEMASTTTTTTTTTGGANSNQSKRPQHLVLRARSFQATPANSTSGGSTSSSGAATASASSAASRPRPAPGFHPDLVCITPLLVVPTADLDLGSGGCGGSTGTSPINPALSLVAPPRVTALTVQAQHNILAYAHELGVVLVDLVQKCVIMNASLADLYGTMSSNRDLSLPPPIQPFATSSILQHHFQAAGPAAAVGQSEYSIGASKLLHNSGQTTGGADNGGGGGGSNSLGNSAANAFSQFDSTCEPGDNGPSSSSSLYKSGTPNEGTNAPVLGQTQSRHTANSMFQRQLSTTALFSSSPAGSTASGTATPPARPSTVAGGPRLFQRQMTAAQLFSSGGGCQGAQQAADNKQRAAALLASARGTDLAGSVASLCPSSAATASESRQQMLRSPRRGEAGGIGGPYGASSAAPAAAAGAKTTNKRIISRMLSISAIHTSGNSGGGGGGGSGGSGSGSQDDHQEAAAVNSSTPSSMGGDQAPDKLDSSFTRSRSSSSGSVVAPTGAEPSDSMESIQCLCLVDWTQATCAAHSSPNNKSPASIAASQQLALWLGTSQGAVLLVSLQMPDSEDNRVLQLQSVLAEPQPQAAQKLPGAILHLGVFQLDASRAPPGGSSGSSLESHDSSTSPTLAAAASGPQESNGAESASSRPLLTGHFLAVVSEREARVHQIPQTQQQQHQQDQHKASGGALQEHQHHHHHAHQGGPNPGVQAMASLLSSKSAAYSRTPLADSSFACRSALVLVRPPSNQQQEEPCLVSYLANGNLRVHSLPKLRLLLDADFVPYTSRQLARSMEFSRQAHCLYRPSPSEIAKFSVSAQYGSLVNDMTGTLFVAREMPEQPRANFFKSLFSSVSGAGAVIGGRQSSDRDELFGECAKGSSSRSVAVAKHLGSQTPAAGFEKLKSAAVGTMGHDMRMAREGLDERGEKLSDLEDRTLQMMNQSENYAQAAHQLAQKFKDKKWYQF